MAINVTPGAVAPALIAPTATTTAAAAGACAGVGSPSATNVDAAVAAAVAPLVVTINLLLADIAAMRAVLVANGWGRLV